MVGLFNLFLCWLIIVIFGSAVGFIIFETVLFTPLAIVVWIELETNENYIDDFILDNKSMVVSDKDIIDVGGI